MSIALYELSTAYQNVLSLIDDEGTNDDILNALTVIEGQIEDKATNIANLIKSLEAESGIIKAEEERLEKRRKSRENAVKNVRQYLQTTMEQLGKDNIKTPFYTFNIQSNNPSMQVLNEAKIPRRFFTVVPERLELNKKMVNDMLKAKRDVPGVSLVTSRSLRIR